MVKRARLSDGFERYLDFRDSVVAAVGSLVATTGDDAEDMHDAITALRLVYGRRNILLQLHAALREGMVAYRQGIGRIR